MELEYFGANCLKITTKKTTLSVDDNLSELGAKAVTKPQEIAIVTSGETPKDLTASIVINSPGEYEISGVSIMGISARGYRDEAGKESATIFKIMAEDIRLVITGHIQPDLTDAQLEAIGTVDVLCLPVGGAGLTMDGMDASKVVREIEPKVIVPTYYQDKKIKYPMPVAGLEEALKELGMEASETLPKLKIKAAELGESTRLVVLES